MVSSSLDVPLLGLLGISDKVDVAFVASELSDLTYANVLLIVLSLDLSIQGKKTARRRLWIGGLEKLIQKIFRQ